MLLVISPAKTLNFEKAKVVQQNSLPEFSKKTEPLVKQLRSYSANELMELMSISQKLAQLNVSRFKEWNRNPDISQMKQAICAFDGDVYAGLNVSDWTDENYAFAQEHLRILSGMYGVLRPLDYIQPYRLEMGTKLPNPKGETLYDYWTNDVTTSLKKQLLSQGDQLLINLASNEYFKVIQTKKLGTGIITPVFKDAQNGEYKVVSFWAKKARGMMSRFIIKNRLLDAEYIKEFSDDGYSFNDRLTKGNEWVFTRDLRP